MAEQKKKANPDPSEMEPSFHTLAEAVEFHTSGSGLGIEEANGHSGEGWYVYDLEVPDEGATFLCGTAETEHLAGIIRVLAQRLYDAHAEVEELRSRMPK